MVEDEKGMLVRHGTLFACGTGRMRVAWQCLLGMRLLVEKEVDVLPVQLFTACNCTNVLCCAAQESPGKCMDLPQAVKKRNRHLGAAVGSRAARPLRALDLLSAQHFYTSPRLAALATQGDILSQVGPGLAKP